MIIFYILFGCFIFVLSGIIFQFNRKAIYRRRVIRHLSETSELHPFVLSAEQERKVKESFRNGESIQTCLKQL